MSIPAVILCAVFVVLAGVHLVWAFGGAWRLHDAVPTRDGAPLFNPGRALTLLVAVVLLSAAFVPVWISAFPAFGPPWVPRAAVWVIATVFGLRAIGDFRYCGFFKRVRETPFARNDSWLYSPLCVVISLVALWLALSS